MMLPPRAKPPVQPLSSQDQDHPHFHAQNHRRHKGRRAHAHIHHRRHQKTSLIPTISKESSKSSLTASFSSSGSSCSSRIDPENSSILRGAQILRQQLQEQSWQSTPTASGNKDTEIIQDEEALHDLLLFRQQERPDATQSHSHSHSHLPVVDNSHQSTQIAAASPLRRQSLRPSGQPGHAAVYAGQGQFPDLLAPHSMQVRGGALGLLSSPALRPGEFSERHSNHNAFTPYAPASSDRRTHDERPYEYPIQDHRPMNTYKPTPRPMADFSNNTLHGEPNYHYTGVEGNGQALDEPYGPSQPQPLHPGDHPCRRHQLEGWSAEQHEYDPSISHNKDQSLNRTVDTTRTEETLNETKGGGFLDQSRDAFFEVDDDTRRVDSHAMINVKSTDDVLEAPANFPNDSINKHQQEEYRTAPKNARDKTEGPMEKDRLIKPSTTASSSPTGNRQTVSHGQSNNLLCGSGLKSYAPKNVRNRQRNPLVCRRQPSSKWNHAVPVHNNEHAATKNRTKGKSSGSQEGKDVPSRFSPEPFTLDNQDRFAILSPTSDTYALLRSDAGFQHAQNAGSLWQSLVGQHVRFPSEWWCEQRGSARTAPLGCNRRINDKNQWVYYDRHRIRSDPFLVQYISKRDHPGRLLLHIVVQDFMTCAPVLDIAIGCFHPNARAIRSAASSDPRYEECRDVWMATRTRTEESISVIDPMFLSNIMGPARSSPLGSRRPQRISNLNVRAVFGELPPIRTVFAPESEVYETLATTIESTNAGPADRLLRQYLFTYDD